MQKIIDKLKFNSGGLLEFMVIKMISGQTHSVDEILTSLKDNGLKTPKGSLYPLLGKLSREGLIIKGYEDGDDRPAMKTYDLTEKGRQRLYDLRGDWKRLNSVIASLG